MADLRVELAIDSPTGCPVVEAAERTAAPARGATWSEADGRTVEQFELAVPDADLPDDFGAPTPSSAREQAGAATAVDTVFEHDDGTVLEFERDDEHCACERIEAAGLPIADVRAEDDTLLVTLHLDDEVEFGGVLERVREVAEAVSVRSISRSAPEDDGESDLVLVDRGRLTDRQREVLLTARAMGYYQYPRGANASEVADALDICPSTLSEHLAAAQSKLLDETFGALE